MWLLLPLLLSPVFSLSIVKPPSITRAASSEPQERFVNVRRDQFSRTRNDTFPMRFYYNELNVTDKNIVVFVGAEWAISPSGASGGLAFDIATAIGASLFYTEHRYYGKSRLTEDISTAALELLTEDQVLRDLAQFVEYVKSDAFENGQYKSGKVVFFGCSLAGSMSVWMRQLYPQLADVAVSDSGPLLAQEDFTEYFVTAARIMRFYGGDQCVQSLKDATDAIMAIANTTQGDAQITETLETCTDFVGSDPFNVYTLFNVITTLVHEVVQDARPGDVTAACATLSNTSIANPMQRLASLLSNSASCIVGQYAQMVSLYNHTNYDGYAAEDRMWRYQMCHDFGWFKTTTSASQPFGSNVPLEFFRRTCRDFFSQQYDDSEIGENIRRTNTFFRRSLPEHVIIVKGSEDPWAPLQPTLSQNTANTPVYEIKAAHCRATDSIQNSDSEEIRRVKKKVVEHVKHFINRGDHLEFRR